MGRKPQVANKAVESLNIGRFLAGTYKAKVFAKTVFTVCSILFTFMLGTFGSLYLLNEKGGFSISLEKIEDMEKSISISATEGFEDPTTNLTFENPTTLYNVSYTDVPDYFTVTTEGDGYIAYVFYVKNTGKVDVNISVELEYSGVTKGCDEAIRFKVLQDDQGLIYAKRAADGTLEYGTVAFEEEGLIYKDELEDVQPDEIIKYSVIVWFEGDDKECVNAISGGQISIEMHFGIVEKTETPLETN